LALDLHLQTFHETISVKDTLHADRVIIAQFSTTLSSVRSSNILGVAKHEVQLSRLELVALCFLGTQCLQTFEFRL
jgi:hypothetical protein